MSVLEMKVPSPGESISEVEIAAWLVADGDYVEKDQEIAEIKSRLPAWRRPGGCSILQTTDRHSTYDRIQQDWRPIERKRSPTCSTP